MPQLETIERTITRAAPVSGSAVAAMSPVFIVVIVVDLQVVTSTLVRRERTG